MATDSSIIPFLRPPERNAPTGPGRWPALDGLRGVAVLGVLAFHAQFILFRGGCHGVDLFFVLSGFLITALIVREHERTAVVRIRRFYLRRHYACYRPSQS